MYKKQRPTKKNKNEINKLTIDIKDIDPNFENNDYDIKNLLTNKITKYMEIESYLRKAISLNPQGEEYCNLWLAQILELQGYSLEANLYYRIYEILSNNTREILNLNQFIEKLNDFEPITINYDDIFKNDIISKFKSKFEKLNYFNNYTNIREIGKNLAISYNILHLEDLMK